MCGGAAFDWLRRRASPTLYSGCFTDYFDRDDAAVVGTHAEHRWAWELPAGQVSHRYRADEMFVVLGPALVDRLVKRRYCTVIELAECDDRVDLYDTNYAGQSLGLWLAPYNADLDIQPLNDVVLHYAGKPKMRFAYATLDVETFDVCWPFVAYHKANATQMASIFSRHAEGHHRSRKPKAHRSAGPPPDLRNLTGRTSWVEALMLGG